MIKNRHKTEQSHVQGSKWKKTKTNEKQRVKTEEEGDQEKKDRKGKKKN